MADDEKGGGAEGESAVAGPVAADGGELTFVGWDLRMTAVQRVEPDPEDDGPDDLFSVTFAVDGPNASAEVGVMVADVADIDTGLDMRRSR